MHVIALFRQRQIEITFFFFRKQIEITLLVEKEDINTSVGSGLEIVVDKSPLFNC